MPSAAVSLVMSEECGGARWEQAQGACSALQLGAEGSWSGIQVSWHREDCRLEQVTVNSCLVD